MTNTKKDTKANEHAASSSSSRKTDILPDSLLQSIRQNVSKLKEDWEAVEAKRQRRARLVPCLPETFDMVLLIFQGSDRSILTEKELLKKIIVHNRKIVDRGEVEEQLKLLREILPDWLTEKSSSSAGILYSINKQVTVEELGERLALAK